jgi:hypothetical protein
MKPSWLVSNASSRPAYDACMTCRYLPPAFALYEFDDTAFEPGLDRRRWFGGWHGPAGEPAEQVMLTWAAGDRAVLVATTDRAGDPEMARLSAALLALGGDELPVAARPSSPREVHRELRRISAAAGLWSPAPPVAPAGPPADVAVLDGYVLAVSQAGPQQVLIAAVGLDAEQFEVRPVRDWAAYDVDATKGHSLAELNQALERRQPGGGPP